VKQGKSKKEKGKRESCGVAVVAALLLISTAAVAQPKDLADPLEAHARNKQQVLEQLRQMPQLTLTRCFGRDFRETWRQVLIDGADKQDFLRAALRKLEEERGETQKGEKAERQEGEKAGRSQGEKGRRPSSVLTFSPAALHQALTALADSHRRLFGLGGNAPLMIRPAADPAFRAFGRHLTLAAALAEMTDGNPAEVQAFGTLFETGQNTRGYVHKLESHASATEYIYALTDIVYGVLLPSELEFGADKVNADPRKVQMFYVRAGAVIALHPYVLHSGSLSVEPDRSFSILIYKRPAAGDQHRIVLPAAWEKAQSRLKIAGADRFYLTLAELYTDDLKDLRGFITAPRPLRLPDWR